MQFEKNEGLKKGLFFGKKNWKKIRLAKAKKRNG